MAVLAPSYLDSLPTSITADATFSRRQFSGLVGTRLLPLGLLIGCKSSVHFDRSIRIGYQKWGSVSILKARQTLELALNPLGCSVEWLEFSAGPPLLEALNAGAVDFGHTGDSPPIFAQASGVAFRYVGASTPCPDSSGIVVSKESPILSLEQLKGRRVGYTRGSSAHTMLLRALATVNLSLNDVESTFLSPSDGRAAFQSQSIDAWSIWDPYLALAEQEGFARLLAGGTGFVAGRANHPASEGILDRPLELVTVVLRELSLAKQWATEHAGQAAELLSEQVGMSATVLKRAETRLGRYGVETDTAVVIAEQQKLANEFFEMGVLAAPVDVQSYIDFVHPTVVQENGLE